MICSMSNMGDMAFSHAGRRTGGEVAFGQELSSSI
jgi:hypothetical protein